MALDATPFRLPPDNDALQRIGTLAARGWHAKLYAPTTDAAGLRPEDLTAANRAYRAGVAAPGTSPVAGFALLRFGDETGSLAFSACWWEGAMLHRMALLLPSCGSPPRRANGICERIGCVDEVLLMAREAAAWRRCVLDAALPSPEVYLAECCA